MMASKKRILNIVKIGGKLMEEETRLQKFLAAFSQMEGHKILVHGGGIMATQLSKKLGYGTTMLNGRRITDKNAIKIIVMTYAGLLNKNLVAGLHAIGAQALGLCGADGGSIISRRRSATPIDYGFVGDVEDINSEFIISLLDKGIIPVFSAISCTREGVLLNTNADSIATEIAKAMVKEFEVNLYFCMEKKGVMLDITDENSVIKKLDPNRYRTLVEEGKITDGMLPKLENCFKAVANEVTAVYLGDASLIEEGVNGTKITS